MFATREAAIEYVTDTVFERAHNLGVKVLSNDNWKTRWGRSQVRKWLERGNELRLILLKDDCGEPVEWVGMSVVKTEYSR